MTVITLTPILLSFLVTLLIIPLWIIRAKRVGLEGKDVHKKQKEKIAESGGVPVLLGFVLGILTYITFQTFFFNSTSNLAEIFALLIVIILIALIGFVDDIFGWKIGLNKKTRIFLVLFASIPLISINAGKSFISIPFNGVTDLGLFYPLVLIPLGILGATISFNLLAGYNGLEAGNGILILSALALVSFLIGEPWLAVISLIMVASLLAFIFYNFIPAKIFPGDSLTYPVGALIAVIAILGSFERVALFFFIPLILETFLKLRGKLKKESFGKQTEKGFLTMPYKKIYGLEHLSIYLMEKIGVKPTEKRVVYSLWVFQLIIIILGLIIFREGIF